MKQITLLFSLLFSIFSANAQDCSPISSPWTGVDIGDVALTGTSCYDSSQDTFDITASGADIWGASDEFHYVYQELTGDGEIIAKVGGLTNTHPWAKAGVMMRSSIETDAAQILMSLSTNPINLGVAYSLQDRPSKGAIMIDNLNNIGPVPVGSFPYYVRLVREGNNFTGYASATNGDWTLVGIKSINMNETILVGLATTSHRDGTATVAEYSEVKVEEANLIDPTAFVTTWKTDNPGTSADNQITIPTFPGETYNYSVDWGDGTLSTGVTGDVTHTYITPGTYSVSISGIFPRIYFNDDNGFDELYPDNLKLLLVNQWGNTNWSSMNSAFYRCFNLDIIADDTPDLSQVSDISNMLSKCTSLVGNQAFNNWDVSNVSNMASALGGAFMFNQDVGNWDTSSVISMYGMFFNATSFNQDISSWNVSNVTNMQFMFQRAMAFNQNLGDWRIENVSNMERMFDEAGLSPDSYDNLLNGWSSKQVQNGVLFGGNIQYCQAEEARQKLINDFGWTITDGGKTTECEASERPFVTTWKTDNPGITQNNQIRIPAFPGETYNFSVDWGDGSSNNVVTDSITHTYAIAGTYQIGIRGNYPRIYYGDFGNSGDKRKLISVDQWGDIQWSTMSGAFAYCNNVQILATDAPDLSRVTSLANMFRHSDSMNNDLSAWDFSTITDMENMFLDADIFNQDVNGWNTSNVTTMYGMFLRAVAFNQDISGWDTSNVTNMGQMFDNALSFDQDLSNLDISSVTSMQDMFSFSGLSIGNYDSMLISWSELEGLYPYLSLGAQGIYYCQGEEARQRLINDYGWTITDGGLSAECDVLGLCTSLPSSWTGTDIGAVATAGTSCYNALQDTFAVTASGADIWGTDDEFHYVYQELIGDGEIIARVDGLTNTHPWAKAGVMMRNSVDSDAAQILMSLSTNPVNVGIGYTLQDRPSKGVYMSGDLNNIGPVPVGSFPYYVRLVREGNNFTGYASASNGNWTLVGTKAITMNETILVGLATTSHSDGTLALANYAEVAVKRVTDPVENNPPKIFLEGDEFMALFNGEPYIEQGAMAIDIEDGDISDAIIINGTVDSTNPGTYLVYYLVTDSQGATASETRTVQVEQGPDFTPPEITLLGLNPYTLTVGIGYEEFGATAIDDVDGDISQDLINDISGVDFRNPGTYFVTYNVTDSSGNNAQQKERTVIIVPAVPDDICLPLPWRKADIGDVALTGASCYDVSSNTFVVTASGADIWGTDDEFHFVYQRLLSDGEIIARVDGLTNTHPWAKAGVMMRNSLDSDAAQILMSLSTNPVNVGIGYSLQDRPSKGVAMRSDLNNIGPVPVGSFPYYVRLVREGNSFTGYASATNGNWTLVGTKTIAMDATILVGLATTSHNDGVSTTANYADVELQGLTSAAERVDSRMFESNTEDQAQNKTITEVSSNAVVVRTNLLEMRTYPNPSSETVNVSFGTILNISAFQIYDVTGRLVATQKAHTAKNGNGFQLDVSSFETGSYFLRGNDAAGRIYQKQFIIKR